MLANTEIEELQAIKGIGMKRAEQLMAVYELIRSNSASNSNPYKINSPEDASLLIMQGMRYLKKECLKFIMLNTKNYVMDVRTISVGSLNSSVVHPREVYSIAIKKLSSCIIICHNHPSGDPIPSQEDINITKRLFEVGKLMGIDLLDHIIIGDGRYISLKEKGIL